MKKQRKPIPRAGVFALIIGGALFVAVVGYLVLVKPQHARLKKLNADIENTQKQIDDARAQTASQTSTPEIKIADVYRLAQAMPSNGDMPDVLLQLDDVAKSAGVELASITPQAPQPGAGFSIQPITLQFSGDYYAITDLLYRLRTLVAVRHGQLEASGRIFSIQSVDLTPSGSLLQANVTVDTYVYSGAAAPAAAATPAPTSTDTTATTGSTDTTSTTTASALPAQGAP